MPIKEAAKKALRQNKKRRARNLQRKRKIKNLRKEIEELLTQNKKGEARKLYPSFQKAVDKAAQTSAIHANKAARLKSRLKKKLGET